jgi:outer membrane lipoprotein LolB
LLSSCASLPAQRAPADGLASNYAGRFSLAVTHPSIGGEDRREAWSGRFSLAVGTQSLSLDLVSPLGATIARFETDTQEARLVVPASGGVRVEHGADAQSLSERVLGWSLPITGMPDWIAGHPAKGRPFWSLPPLGADGADVVRQADGVASAGSAPDRFEQDGWRVTVERPDGDRAGLRLQMDRAAQDDSPAVALRVVLDTPAAPAGEAGARPGSQ